MEINMLTQKEASQLIAMKKLFLVDGSIVLNESFNNHFDLISENKEEHFILDLRQGRIELKKIRYQNRYDETIPLVRFESIGIHENPDGEIIKGAHLHIFREGYADKFAIPAPENFMELDDILHTLKRFCEYCNIEGKHFEYQSINMPNGAKRK